MKKLIPMSLILLLGVNILAQTSLSFEQHALKANCNNPMTYCEYVEPGTSGSNQVWDFTGLKALKEFTGILSEANGTEFSSSNTILDEFGTKFFFEVSESSIEQYGYQSESGRSKIVYSQPFEKIRFPFSFTDAYRSTFAADYFNDNIATGQIDGSAFIEADAWGTLHLPGGSLYQNTLRIKTVKEYTLTFENSEQDVKMITYRWYNSTHRYPLLVLTEITTSVNDKNIRTKTQAAYNSNAVTLSLNSKKNFAANGVKLYPNPATDFIAVDFESISNNDVLVTITDIEGRELYVENIQVQAGINELQFSDAIANFSEGIYFLRLRNSETEEIIEFSIKK